MTQVESMRSIHQWLMIALICQLLALIGIAQGSVNTKTSELIRSKGFLGVDHDLKVNSRYTLNLVRIGNPLINNGTGKDPRKRSILFIHGILGSSNMFLTNSQGANPKDISQIDIPSLTDLQLNAMVNEDPTSKSLPLLLANAGHDVWLMNRRPTLESQEASGQTLLKVSHNKKSMIKSISIHQFRRGDFESFFQSILGEVKNAIETMANPYVLTEMFNPLYWNFSIDEQADEDLPAVIDYILKQDGRSQVSIAAHSVGSAMVLMMLSNKPELQEKIGKSILMAPAMDLKINHGTLAKILKVFEPLTMVYIGPVPLSSLTPAIEAIMDDFCESKSSKATECVKFLDVFLGESKGQIDYLDYIKNIAVPMSSHELTQLDQALKYGKMHYFDYRNPIQNYQHYKKMKPPEYDLKKVNASKFSIWLGNTDKQVSFADGKQLVSRLGTPGELHFLNDTGIAINHIGFQCHRDVATLINAPSLRYFETV